MLHFVVLCPQCQPQLPEPSNNITDRDLMLYLLQMIPFLSILLASAHFLLILLYTMWYQHISDCSSKYWLIISSITLWTGPLSTWESINTVVSQYQKWLRTILWTDFLIFCFGFSQASFLVLIAFFSMYLSICSCDSISPQLLHISVSELSYFLFFTFVSSHKCIIFIITIFCIHVSFCITLLWVFQSTVLKTSLFHPYFRRSFFTNIFLPTYFFVVWTTLFGTNSPLLFNPTLSLG